MGLFKFIGGVATPFLQKSYWFKKDGKNITQKEYCEWQGKIGPDVPPSFNLQTNHPDACGLKAKREKARKENDKKK